MENLQKLSVERGWERVSELLLECQEADRKERLSVLRTVTAFVEAVNGKRTIVEHRHQGQSPVPAGMDSEPDLGSWEGPEAL